MRLKILLPFLFCTVLAAAQSVDSVQLKGVTVEASRATVKPEEAPRSIEIITSDRIKALPVRTIDDLLELAIGADVRSRGPLGMQSDISMRGGSFEQTLVLLNGIPLSDPQTGHHTMNLPVSTDDIDHVEIIQGGAARVFGPKAFSGAINIVTKKTEGTGATVTAAGGDYGTYKTGAAAGVGCKKAGIRASLSHSASQGYVSNTDFDQYEGSFQADATLGKVYVHGFGGVNDKGFGAQNFYTSSFPTQFEQTQTRMAGLNLSTGIGAWIFRLNGSFRRNNDRFELYREGHGWYEWNNNFYVMGEDTAPSWYTGHNYHRTDVYQTAGNVSYSLNGHVFSAGAEYRKESILSNVLGESLTSPEHVPGYGSDIKFYKGAWREEYNAFLEDQFTAGKWLLNAGVLMTRSTDYGTRLFPGIDVLYHASKSVRLFANVNQSVRYPTYTDLYYKLGGAVGSKDLLPEKSLNYEAGMRWIYKQSSLQASVFRRDSKSLIDWIRKDGTSTTEAANITEVSFTGVDVAAHLSPTDFVTEAQTFSSINLKYTLVTADQTSSGFESNYVLDFLKHKFTAELVQPLMEHLQLSWVVNYQVRQGGYVKPGEKTETEFPKFYTADVRLLHTTHSTDLWLDVNNLFNRGYVDIGNVEQPGRWISGGVTFRFFGKKQ